jgi:hypothetical protein
MDELLASFHLFSRDTAVAVGISLVSLLISLLGYLRIRTVGNAIHQDRDLVERLLVLPEIQFHLDRASRFLSFPREKSDDEHKVREALKGGLELAYNSIDIVVKNYYGRWEIGNPFVLAAERFKTRGAVSQAIYWYERALQSSDALGVNLSDEELRQCVSGLQRCHLMRFDRERAKGVARRATKLDAVGCRTEEEVRRNGWLLCSVAALELLWRRLRHPAWNRPRKFPVNTKKH